MKKSFTYSWIFILLFGSGCGTFTAGPSVVLVKDGVAKSTIVMAEKPTRSAQIASRELQEHIEAITGAKLEIQSEKVPIPRGIIPIYVGESSFTKKLKLTSDSFAPQESLIKITDKYIVFIGRDDPDYGKIAYDKIGTWRGFNHWKPFYRLGSLYAVYDFLEDLCGVRWYMVTDLGRVVPHKKTLAFSPISRKSKPWTIFRNTSRNVWQIPGEIPIKGKPMKSAGRKDNNLFLLRCRLGGEPFAVCHSVNDYFKRFGKEHRDWFADKKPGNPRIPYQPRFDHPEIIKRIAEDAEAFFKLPYAERKFGSKITQGASVSSGNYFSVAPLDNRFFGKDLKPPAQPNRKGPHFGNGVYSNYYFTAVNKVAAIVRKKYPNEWISAIAYAGMFEAPDFKLEPNIAVCVCMADGWEEGGYGMKNLEDWRTKVEQLFTWEYYLEKIDDFPKIRPHSIAKYIRKLEELRINGWFSEMPSFWGKGVYRNPALNHLNAYVTYLMLRKRNVDIDSVLNEYYTLFYGPASEPMAEFWETLEKMSLEAQQLRKSGKIKRNELTWNKVASPEKLEELLQLLNKAEKAASEEPYAKRIQLIRKCVLGRLERSCFEYRIAQQGTPRINCPVTTHSPIINGKLENSEWKNAVVIDTFSASNVQPRNGECAVYLMHDDNFLYIGSHYIQGSKTPTEQQFTFFFDPGRTRRNFYTFSITPENRFNQKSESMTIKYHNMFCIDKLIKKNRKWKAKIKHAVYTGKKEWSAELAIPLKELGQAKIDKNALWGANFVYSSKVNKLHEIVYWSTGKGGYNDPDDFGIMTFDNTSWESVCFDFEDNMKRKVKGVDENGNPVLQGGLRGKWSNDSRVKGKEGYACLFGDEKRKRYIHLAPKIRNDNFTISFWMKAAPQHKGAHVVFSTTSPPYWGIILTKPDENGKSRLKFGFNAGWNTSCFLSKAELEPNKWYFITYTINRGKDIRLYVNAQLDSIGSREINLHTKPFKDIVTIGGPYNFYTGVIDSFRISKGDLSQKDIQKLYNKKSLHLEK